jgi:flagellar protein FliJ
VAAFGLAGLLRIRRLKEERAAYEMVRARSRASELASERHQLLEQLDDHAHEARDVRGIHALAAARASTSGMLADLEALSLTQRRLVADAEEAHREARKDVRAVEKLEEKFDEAEHEEELRREQTILDELASRARRRLQQEAGE